MDLRDVIVKVRTLVDTALIAHDAGDKPMAEQYLICAETLIKVEVRGINEVQDVPEAEEEGAPEESKSKTPDQDEAAGKS